MELKGKKVLVTGSEGFIGSHLVERLIKEGANLTALVQYNSFNNWGWLETLDERIKSEINIVTGDVREYDGMSRIIKGQNAIFHLAALIAIPYSYNSPMAYVKTNVEGTLNVLEAARNYDIERVMHTSTSETYGTAQYVPIDEKHPLQGQSPYSASKIGADMMAESYYKSFDLPITIARPFNTFGPRQSARAIIPTIISQILSGQNSLKLGDLSPMRDFNYVKDTVDAMCTLLKCDAAIGEVVNIGTGNEISMKELVDTIIRIIGKDVKIEKDPSRMRPAKSEVRRLLADNKKMKELASWHSSYTFEEGIKETITWVENNMKYFKANIYNV